MTNQEAFTTAVLGVIAQGRAAYDPYESSCRYRDHEGNKCALGMLIPDDQYDPQIEGAPAQALVNGSPKLEWHAIPALAGLDVQMLRDLQSVHDNTAEDKPDEDFIPEFIIATKQLATKYNLTFPTIP